MPKIFDFIRSSCKRIFFTTFIPLINCLTIGHYFVKKCQRKSTLNIRNQKRNIALLFQFVFISIVFVIYMAIYWVQDVGLINTNLDISLALLSVLNSSVKPYLYTAFSSEIRSKLLKSNKSVISANTLSTKKWRRLTFNRRPKIKYFEMDEFVACICIYICCIYEICLNSLQSGIKYGFRSCN